MKAGRDGNRHHLRNSGKSGEFITKKRKTARCIGLDDPNLDIIYHNITIYLIILYIVI